jgi:hypothetical protein
MFVFALANGNSIGSSIGGGFGGGICFFILAAVTIGQKNRTKNS